MSNLEDLVKAYLTIRVEREKILHEYEEQDKKLKEDMTLIEQSMLSVCNDTNADSIKTQHGTVIRKLNERFYCNDWDNFRNFVLDNEAVELLERRIHQGNFKEFMSEHQQDGLPPGVNVMREFGIVVRKPVSS
tara:strand:+ start:192 stop:590 length:399 start_codon:yes stop_codon:yes gene_type:complete